MTGATRGAFPGEPVLELSVRNERPARGPSLDVIPAALRIADLAYLVQQALDHGLPDDTVVIFERSGHEGAARVRVTGAGVRVPVRESNLRLGTPASASLGAAAVEVRGETPAEYGRRAMLEAKAEAWQEGFDAGHEWWVSNPGPGGTHSDPPRNPHESRLETSGPLTLSADLQPGERFAELGGVVAPESHLRPRPVRDNPQA